MPDRISLWISEHRRLVGGALIVGVATAFAAWVSMASLPFGDQREVVVHWFGGGAYLLAAVLAVFGVLTGITRVRSTVRQDRRLLRQSGGVGLAALALWGIAGAFTPDASLGGVSLSRYGAGGQVGGWLDSPVGWGLILLGLIGAFASDLALRGADGDERDRTWRRCLNAVRGSGDQGQGARSPVCVGSQRRA